MSKNYLPGIVIFIVILVLLNFFFHLHISIIGSLVLTVVLNVALMAFNRR